MSVKLDFHPLDDKDFIKWLKENDMENIDEQFGIYGSKWMGLYMDYQDELTDERCRTNQTPCLIRAHSDDNTCRHWPPPGDNHAKS